MIAYVYAPSIVDTLPAINLTMAAPVPVRLDTTHKGKITRAKTHISSTYLIGIVMEAGLKRSFSLFKPVNFDDK